MKPKWIFKTLFAGFLAAGAAHSAAAQDKAASRLACSLT